MRENQLYWVWLTQSGKLSAQTLACLVDQYDGIEDIYEEKDYSGIYGVGPRELSILEGKDLSKAEQILQKMHQMGGDVLTFDDIAYPDVLRQIGNPPYVLYYRGEVMQWDRLLLIAVIGTRNSTPYGMEVTKELVRPLAANGVTVVSGMARGLDSAAAWAALSVGNKTIAVLGSGLDIVYPPENGPLMEKIIQNGIVLSEYPPGTQALPRHFPERNRIISGLARGVLITEAGRRSGTMNTFHHAMEEGKDLFAVPGNIVNQPMSVGTNVMIQNGAKLVQCAKDILEEYSYELGRMHKETMDISDKREKINRIIHISTDDKKYSGLNPQEKKIIGMLIERNRHIDDIVQGCDLPVNIVGSLLTILEMKGLIRQLPGKNFKLVI
jgi:DNA processing protein